MGYDPLDREVSKLFANGMVLTQTFDPAGNQTLRQYWSPGGDGILIHTATYDPTGNRLTVQELNGDSSAYSYDPTSQLIYEQRVGANAYQITYSYDGAGNRLLMNSAGALTTYAYGPANNLLTAQSPANVVTTYTFDSAGNQTIENANGALTTYIWDGEDRQKIWTPAGGTSTTFIYSADGLRRSTNSAGGLFYNVWDEQNLLRMTNAAGTTQQRFTDHPGDWGGLTSLQDLVGLVTAQFGFDISGNTRVLTAPNGAISDQYWFTANGVELNSSGTTNNIHHFSGQYGGIRQSALLTVLGQRIFEAMVARWISRDPIGFDGGDWNLYRYVGNNSPNVIDPSGQSPFACEICATKIAQALWCTPQHACSHDYIHCVSCCLLARRFGPHCARYAQWWQNWFGDTDARSRWCEDGIKGIYSRNMSCTAYCLQKYLHPFPSPKPCCSTCGSHSCDIRGYSNTACVCSFDCCAFLKNPTPAPEPAC